ncbi:MAG: division/cell wall cluster transcriptional repressor MraZ [Clostridiaceae bacterium]|nr:division/cell wall cluster transcriptional repressor MraZ [Clostridiaceae bacterium]
MFYGEFQHTVDQKGRIIIPSAFREELNVKFMLTKGLEECLFIFSMPRWNSLVEKLETLPLSNTNARSFTRFFFSSAAQCEMDKNYRILIPPDLRNHAELEKEISIVGVGNRVEVWSRDRWEKYIKGDSLNPDSLSDTFAMLGI